MRAELAIAAAGCVLLAVGHTTIGVRWVLPALDQARLPRTRFGSPVRMLRFTWHVVTLVQLTFAGLLATLAVAPRADTMEAVLRWLAASFAAAAVLLVWSNRRHLIALVRFPLPFVFVLIAVMCVAAVP
jgi:hypothetical protein